MKIWYLAKGKLIDNNIFCLIVNISEIAKYSK